MFNFLVLPLYQGIICISIRVVLGEYVQGFGVLSFVDQETRRLGGVEKDQGDDGRTNYGGNTRKPPTPLALDLQSNDCIESEAGSALRRDEDKRTAEHSTDQGPQKE